MGLYRVLARGLGWVISCNPHVGPAWEGDIHLLTNEHLSATHDESETSGYSLQSKQGHQVL